MKIDSNDIVNANEISLLQSMICPICFCIPTNPIFCNECDHIFCPDCTFTFTNCPLCRNAFVSTPVAQNSIITEQLKEIRMKCKYSKYGCNELLPIAQKEYHETKCDYLTRECDKCHNQVIIKKVEKHLFKDCHKNKVQCFLCEKYFNISKLPSHVKNCNNSSEEIIKKIRKCNTCNKFMFNNECHNCTFNDESSYYNKMIIEMKMLMQEKEKEKKEKMKDIYKNKRYNKRSKT